MVLADFGAEVIKIERKDVGSDMYCNRGKKSFSCDLKKPQALEAIQKLIAFAGNHFDKYLKFFFFYYLSTLDILIDPYRPGVMEKLGLGPNECIALNPRLIYARLTGFGQDGVSENKLRFIEYIY